MRAASQAVGLHAIRQWHRFRAAEVACLVWGLAIMKAPSTELWTGVSTLRRCVRLAVLGSQHLPNARSRSCSAFCNCHGSFFQQSRALNGCGAACIKGLLEKLAQASVASFDDSDLHQIYQAYLLLDQQSEFLQQQPHQPTCCWTSREARSMLKKLLCKLLWLSQLICAIRCSLPGNVVAAAKRAGAVAPAGAFPHALLEEAEARWKASVRAPPHGSMLQVPPLLPGFSQSFQRSLPAILPHQHSNRPAVLFCACSAVAQAAASAGMSRPPGPSLESWRVRGHLFMS